MLLLLLLLLLPWSSGAADSSAGAPASAGEDPVAGKIRISEDYRQWAGTMASAMLLRANNDQAAGERELARLQAVTDKLLVNWEAGILPPQARRPSARRRLWPMCWLEHAVTSVHWLATDDCVSGPR